MEATRRGLLGAVAGAGALATVRRARAQGTAPLRIGVLTDLAGMNRDLAGGLSVACTRQAVEDLAAQGGAHGLTVEVLSADHQNKADVGAAIARQWFDRDGVDVVVDVPNSAVALAVAGVCREQEQGVPRLRAPARRTSPARSASPNIVHWTYDTWQLAHSTGGALVAAGGKSWFFITADYAFGQALERDTSAFVDGAGGTVLGSGALRLPRHRGLLLLPAAGAGERRAGGRAVPTPAPTPPTPSSRRTSSA